jgi:hypothetical protein
MTLGLDLEVHQRYSNTVNLNTNGATFMQDLWKVIKYGMYSQATALVPPTYNTI